MLWLLFSSEMRCTLMLLALLASLAFFHTSSAEEGFDVREHLSSTTRYEVSKELGGKIFENDPAPPDGCIPIHLNLVARHGTRAPTKKRLKQLEQLEARTKELSEKSGSEKLALPSEWHNSWKGKFTGGELTSSGEEEMFRLGQRVKERFPGLFQEQYHPDIAPIFTTQVHRSAQSAVAFGMGLFSGQGTLGAGKHRAFAVISDNRTNDIHLRFHDCCQNYKESKAVRKPAVAKLQNEVYKRVAKAATKRFKVDFTNEDISSLWFLCKQEASVLDITAQACGVFSPDDVLLLEWADDVELHHLKGYGDSINYKMGISLLSNVKEAVERAIKESKGSEEFKFLERARLRFAHAETVVPFACLLGLFLDETNVKLVQEEKSVGFPPKPPNNRLWRGSVVAPYGGNTMLVLYKCSGENPGEDSSFKIQALHNENPVIMPACNGTHFCPVDVFMEKVVAPHLKNSFENVCFKPKRPWLSWFLTLLNFGSKSSSQTDQETDL